MCMTADQVRAYIAALTKGNPNKAARIRMAEVAIRRANVTDEGRQAWHDYLAKETA